MIFIDTNVIVSYAVVKDSNHDKSVSLINRVVSGEFGTAITSDYVFDETVTVILVRSKSLETAKAVGNIINDSMNILRVDETVFDNSWKKFTEQRNTRFSFTDCTILGIMEEYGIDSLASFDGEFSKAVPSALIN